MLLGEILVTFNPNIELLGKSINSIIDQIDEILIVDNNSINFTEFQFLLNNAKVKIIKLDDNFGIAYATNIGLVYFKNKRFDYVITSDQDTLYPDDYIQHFKEAHVENVRNEIFVPLFYDNTKKTFSNFIVQKGLFITNEKPKAKYTKVFQAIASGMILSINVVDIIGYLNESLFIDWVDLEWCWRANNKKIEIIGCTNLCISHNLGDTSISIGDKKISLRSPLRHYYITRNALYLALYSDYINPFFRIMLLLKVITYYFGFIILTHEHKDNLFFQSEAIKDGIQKKLGKK